MNVLLVDTSSWITYFKEVPSFKGAPTAEIDLALREGRVLLSPIVAAELLSGKLRSDEKQQLIDFLVALPLSNCSLDHWIAVGELRYSLLRKGLSVSTPDAHIAHACLELDCYLVSEDKIFERIKKHTRLKLL